MNSTKEVLLFTPVQGPSVPPLFPATLKEEAFSEANLTHQTMFTERGKTNTWCQFRTHFHAEAERSDGGPEGALLSK